MNTVIILIALATSLSSALLDDVGQIIQKTKALHESTVTARLTFTQSGSAGSFNGKIIYARGNRFRMELPNQTIVCNGAKTWTYAPAKNQVVITKATGQTGRLTPNEIFTLFPGDYTPALQGEQKIGGKAVWVVQCTAPPSGKRIGDVSEAVLYIDKKSYRFRRIDCKSPSLGAMTLTITSAQYGVPVKDSVFTLTPANGVRIVDLSK